MSPVRAGTGFVQLDPQLSRDFFKKLGADVNAGTKKLGGDASKGFASSFASGVKTGLKDLGVGGGIGALIGAGSIATVVTGMKKIADETAAAAGEVRGLKAATGANAGDASRLVAQFHALGIEVESAKRPLLGLSQQIGEGGGKLKDFFSTAELQRFRRQDLGKTILEIGDRFKQLKDPIAKNTLLVDAFGRRGAALRPILSASREELERFAQTAKRQGLIFNDRQLEQAREYQIAVRELGETFKGLEIRVGKVLVPVLSDLVTAIDEAILSTEDLKGSVSDAGAWESWASAIDRLLGKIGRFDPIFGRFNARFFDWIGGGQKAKESTDQLGRSLDELKATASGENEQAKKLAEIHKQAFADIEAAGQQLERKLDSLIPKIGEVFADFHPKGFVTSDEDRQLAKQVLDAQDRVADAEARLNDVRKNGESTRREISRAERDVADARWDLVTATKNFADVQPSYVVAIEKTMRANATQTQQFVLDLEKLRDRFGNIATDAGAGFEEAFLAHLAELGPGAVPLLDELLRTSDQKLGGLSDIFAGQITAAKRAADFQFAKYPANFAQKIGLARESAVREGQKLIDEFNALPEGSTLQDEMGDQISAIALGIEDVLGPVLDDTKLGFLHTAEKAESARDRVEALQQFINALKGKSVAVDVNVEGALTHIDQVLGKLSSLSGVEATLALIQPEGSPLLPGHDVKTPHVLEDGTVAYFQHGGAFKRDQWAWVGEAGPELVRFGQPGTVIPNDKLPVGASAVIEIHNVIELDGQVVARSISRRHAGELDSGLESYRRSRT